LPELVILFVFDAKSSMQLRTMTESDVTAGMRLKQLAGWNQNEADWKRFLRESKEGCFVAEAEGVVCGSAATIIYGGRFAWVGMVLVDPAYRGRGIGTKLLARCVEHLDQAGVPCIKLDATPLGKPLYEKLGFVTEYELERWILKRETKDERGMGPVETMPEPLLDFVLKADGEAFGADRSAILRSVNDEEPRFTDGLWNAGGMEGYAFGRHGSFADHLGPWIAKDVATGERLLDRFLQQSTRENVIVDCMQANPFAKKLLQARGFEFARPLTRMFRGKNSFPGRPELVCAILGPEFG
jgi:ribosomal protein S18 acetylase RimI-like enzyme